MELAPKQGFSARHSGMIDNAEKTEHSLAKLQAALPLQARATSELVATIQAKHPAMKISVDCSIIEISYAGDEGGIVCRFNPGPPSEDVVYTSITHLRFDPRPPLLREIAVYQKHRIKRNRPVITALLCPCRVC
jgi:hypothetical protein